MTDQEDRNRRKMLLDAEIRACRRCDDMNEEGVTQAAPGWGSLDSPVAIVGQSLCEQCMKPQEPFYEGRESLLKASFTLARCEKADCLSPMRCIVIRAVTVSRTVMRL
jgi:uracil-DNA glycosylase